MPTRGQSSTMLVPAGASTDMWPRGGRESVQSKGTDRPVPLFPPSVPPPLRPLCDPIPSPPPLAPFDDDVYSTSLAAVESNLPFRSMIAVASLGHVPVVPDDRALQPGASALTPRMQSADGMRKDQREEKNRGRGRRGQLTIQTDHQTAAAAAAVAVAVHRRTAATADQPADDRSRRRRPVRLQQRTRPLRRAVLHSSPTAASPTPPPDRSGQCSRTHTLTDG